MAMERVAAEHKAAMERVVAEHKAAMAIMSRELEKARQPAKSQKYQNMSMPVFEKMLASLVREHDYIVGHVEIGGCVQTPEYNGARGYVVNVRDKDGVFIVLTPLEAGGFQQKEVPARLLRRLPQYKKLDESARAGEVMKEFLKIVLWDGS